MHQLTDIAIIATIALMFGMIMTRLRQPAIVGYLLTGMVLGRSVFGFVEDRENVEILAELGVLLLLYLIGMELNLKSFMRIWKTAIGGVFLQVAVSYVVVGLIALFLDWPWELTLLLAFSLSISSTAVAVKILEDIGELHQRTGNIAVGLLIAQDLAVVPMLLIVGSLSGEALNVPVLLLTLGLAVAFLIGLILFLSRRERIHLPFLKAISGHADLTPLFGIVFCLGLAAISGLFGMSPAFGAFLAGLIIGNSQERKGIVEATQPIQSILLMIFFLSIGLLIDVTYIWQNIGLVLLMLLLVIVGKTAINIVILRVTGVDWRSAFIAGTALGQVGEFSFLLMATGSASGYVSRDISQLMITVIALSLMISPLWLLTARRAQSVAAGQASNFQVFWNKAYGKETLAVVRIFRATIGYLGSLTGGTSSQAQTAAQTDAGEVASPSRAEGSEIIIQSEDAASYQAILEDERGSDQKDKN
ncbi:cation:proton antiporter [Sneathiella sp. HT1-7]|uniref:cation:proton antiporter n=1 Tax=Sneathiella sp. HT1-7 TaxID=2887192 RepID=UPI001D137AF9|nr:cation:proton antiporter [Sneathiella sp. HT1-7]MCC3304495.1 cation:proton antiporter [Sneathiella sp. HT1-7]